MMSCKNLPPKMFIIPLVVISFLSITYVKCTDVTIDLDDVWNLFKTTFNKTYESTCEESKRRKIFEDTVELISRHNFLADMGSQSYKLGINSFSDLTHEEYIRSTQSMKLNISDSLPGESFLDTPATSKGKFVDYRTQGMVNLPENQGLCSSSYAFATTGALEAQLKKKTGQLLDLSEQNILDCSAGQGNKGCDGGSPENSYAYIIGSKGIESEQVYPYKGMQNTCAYNVASSVGACTGFRHVLPDENNFLKVLDNIGPMSVILNGSPQSFKNYAGGIYDDPSCDNTLTSQSVVVIGYGAEDKDYWIIKNSFGPTWGENGFARIARGKNRCGILEHASYPVV